MSFKNPSIGGSYCAGNRSLNRGSLACFPGVNSGEAGLTYLTAEAWPLSLKVVRP
jgi:hypothetical protein